MPALERPADFRYLTYKTTGNRYVSQKHLFKFNEDIDVYLDFIYLGYYWKERWSERNDTDEARHKTVKFHSQLRVLDGSESETSFGSEIGFVGKTINFGISGEHKSKTFHETEVTTSEEITDEYTIRPRTNLYVYQRVYQFRCNIWMRRKGRTVVTGDGTTSKKHPCLFEIDSVQYGDTDVELTGETTQSVENPGPRLPHEPVRWWEGMESGKKMFLKLAFVMAAQRLGVPPLDFGWGRAVSELGAGDEGLQGDDTLTARLEEILQGLDEEVRAKVGLEQLKQAIGLSN